MARPYGCVEDRLDQLEAGEHRAQFDSKIRGLITDGVETIPPRRADSDEPILRLISLMEDLAKRMDQLDRKNRNLSEEVRRRDRNDRRRRRSILTVTAVTLVLGLVGGWARLHMSSPPVASIPGD